MDKFINWWPIVTYMTIITIYALFADDLRLIAFSKAADEFFYIITFTSLCSFLLELIMASVAT